jgi:hypothetical protein
MRPSRKAALMVLTDGLGTASWLHSSRR